MNRPYVPDGYRTVTPYFIVEFAEPFMTFAARAFGAEAMSRTEKEGRVAHAELRIGDTIIELSEVSGRYPPRTNTLHLFVPDTDACYSRALEAGAISLYEPADMPYGERSAGVEDPFGNHWYIATYAGEAGNSRE